MSHGARFLLLLSPRTTTPVPQTVPGLTVWLSARQSPLFQNANGTVAAAADGDPVGYWGDLSGNGKHATQSVAGSRPTLRLNSINAKPAIEANGTAGEMAISVGALSTFYLFIVVNMDNVSARNFIGSGGSAFIRQLNATTVDFRDDGGTLVSGTVSNTATTTNYLYEFKAAAGHFVCLRNGAAEFDQAQAFTAYSFSTLFRRATGEFFAGRWAEMMVYNAVPSAAQLTTLRAYFSAQYGVP